MKRDPNLVREILFRAEEANYPDGEANLEIDGQDLEKISYHAKITAEARLIEAQVVEIIGNIGVVVLGLTWEGHEFLDIARDTKIWKRTLRNARARSFELLKSYLIEEHRKQLLPEE